MANDEYGGTSRDLVRVLPNVVAVDVDDVVVVVVDCVLPLLISGDDVNSECVCNKINDYNNTNKERNCNTKVCLINKHYINLKCQLLYVVPRYICYYCYYYSNNYYYTYKV